jgi:hypothetical protein
VQHVALTTRPQRVVTRAQRFPSAGVRPRVEQRQELAEDRDAAVDLGEDGTAGRLG